jgi:hypothetical protein
MVVGLVQQMVQLAPGRQPAAGLEIDQLCLHPVASRQETVLVEDLGSRLERLAAIALLELEVGNRLHQRRQSRGRIGGDLRGHDAQSRHPPRRKPRS